MKAKIFFLLLLFLLQGQSLFSQCISIELSVSWEMGFDIFKKDSVISIPILNITYRNKCDMNYYFFKSSPRRDEELMVLCRVLINRNEFDLQKMAKSHGNYANQNFNVKIGGSPWDNIGWSIEKDNADSISFPYFHISCCLENIYRYFYSLKYYQSKKRDYGYFQPSLFTPENILSSSVQEQFVFLKSDEIHTDTYNLIGYKMVEGCFTFFIEANEIKSYVLASNPNEKGTIEIELPEIVGDYMRYSGPFNTNKVTVCFGEK